MTNKMPQIVRTVEQWKTILNDWEESELSKSTYCRKNNITKTSFYRWSHKINNPDLLNKSKKQGLPRAHYTIEQWKTIIKDWEKSGLSKYTYCIKNNITAGMFYNWYRKFNDPELLNKAKKRELSRTHYTIEQWKVTIQDWEKSGLSKSAYCRKNNINETSFYRWATELQDPDVTSRIKTPKFSSFRSVEQWQEIIEDWKKSGLSRGAYSRKANISSALLRTWSIKLEDQEFVKRRKEQERSRPRYTPEQWREIIEDWRKSGLSRLAYSLKKGVSEGRLYKWEHTFKTLELTSQTTLPVEKQKAPPVPSFEEQFIPVTIKPSPLSNQTDALQKIEVTLAQGHHLSIQGPFNWENLIPLLTSILKG